MMWRRWIKLGAAILFWAVLFGGCHLLHGGWMEMHPKYSEARLLGLTSAQVIERLGSPTSYDRPALRPSSTSPGATRPTADGPLVLRYYQGYATCRIEFRDDRVVSVRRRRGGVP